VLFRSSREIVSTGSENGISYIDIKIFGTTTGANVFNVTPDTGIAASSGQAWSSSVYVTLIAGSTANVSFTQRIRQANSGGGFVAATDQSISPVSGLLKDNRYAVTLSSAAGTVASVGQFLFFSWDASGLAIDITLRIGLPQLEQGATVTSVIPTTTIALTRNADVASMTGTNFSDWYNAAEGTLFVEAIGVNNISGVTRRFAEISDGTANERMVLGYSTTSNTRMLVFDGGGAVADVLVTSGVPAGSLVKMAAAYKVNDFQQASNTTLGTADTSGTLPTVNQMFLGTDTAGATTAAYLNGHIRRIAYYPTRLANSQLQALTG
jgi:hypothetical protein